MPRVVFMCGPAGAGKSTYAATLESQGMTRLSVDAEVWRRGLKTPLTSEVEEQIEADLKRRLLDLVEAGQDVVLDLSFWSREMRDNYRNLLTPLGITAETIFMDTARETILRRLRARAGSHANDIVVPENLAADYLDKFQPPDSDEGPLLIIRTS